MNNLSGFLRAHGRDGWRGTLVQYLSQLRTEKRRHLNETMCFLTAGITELDTMFAIRRCPRAIEEMAAHFLLHTNYRQHSGPLGQIPDTVPRFGCARTLIGAVIEEGATAELMQWTLCHLILAYFEERGTIVASLEYPAEYARDMYNRFKELSRYDDHN